MQVRLSPEAMIYAAEEVNLKSLGRNAYAVDLHEQTGGNVLVVISFMHGSTDRFHVDQLGVIHR